MDNVLTEQLRIIITARNEAAAALQSASRDVGGLGSALRMAGEASLLAGVAVGGALAASLAATVGPAMAFEQTMSGVGAVSAATGAQMQQLSDLAMQLGKDTVFSASQAGQAIEALSKGGIGVQDILGGAARATVNLAAAGGVSLPQAATIAANAMNMFSISGTQMGHIADMIAGAANASSLEVGDFAYSLQYAGAYARSAGLSFDDLAVAIAEMGKQGIVGSSAGTGLADFLARLQPRAGQALKTMQDLGLVTKQGANAFFDAAGHVKSLADVQQILQNATAGLTDQQRAHDLQLIFGMQGQAAANILLRNGAAGYDAMAAAMGRVTAQGVAQARLNNLAGDITNLAGSLETLAIRLGEAFGGGAGMPAFRALAQNINGIVGAMIDWTRAHGPLLARLMPLVATMGGITAAALTLGGAFALLAVAINPVMVGVGLLLAAGAALTAAWATNWGGMRDAVAAAWAGIQPALETLRRAFGFIVQDFQAMPLGTALQASFDIVGAVFGRFTGWMGTTALPAIQQQTQAWATALGTWANQVWAGIQPMLDRLGTQIVGWMTTTTATIKTHTEAWASAFAHWLVPDAAPKTMNNWVTALTAWVNSSGTQAMVKLANSLADAFVAALIAVIKNKAGAIGNQILWDLKPENWGSQFSTLGSIASPLKGLVQGGIETPGGQFSALGTGAQAVGAALTARQPPPLKGPAPEAFFAPQTFASPSGARNFAFAARVAADGVDRALVQHTQTTAAALADQVAIAAQVARVSAPPRPGFGGALQAAIGAGANPLSAAFVPQQAENRGLQTAIAQAAAGGNPLTSAFQQRVATLPTIPPPAAPSGTPNAAFGTGNQTQVNITVQVQSGAVQVNGPGASTPSIRDLGLKLGRQVADALDVFAKSEMTVTPSAGALLPGAR